MAGLQETTRTIPAIGITKLAVTGDTIFIKRCSSPIVVTLRKYVEGAGHQETRIEMIEGDAQLNQEYDSIELSNAGASALNVTIVHGTGEFKRPQTATVLTHATNADYIIPTAVATQLAGGGAPLAGTNSSLVTSLPSNTSEIRVGDSFVSATQGYPLQPGESILMPVGTDLWVYAALANQQISVMAYN